LTQETVEADWATLIYLLITKWGKLLFKIISKYVQQCITTCCPGVFVKCTKATTASLRRRGFNNATNLFAQSWTISLKSDISDNVFQKGAYGEIIPPAAYL